jgi:hypothetical protein
VQAGATPDGEAALGGVLDALVGRATTPVVAQRQVPRDVDTRHSRLTTCFYYEQL